MITVAALYVERGGPYFGMPGVDPWDVGRDARKYAGPHPVVAHPPCARWCKLAGLVEARGGARKGHDGGCFASAIAAVRTWGGVLEHPEGSAAWRSFGLRSPARSGGWTRTADGWTCCVEQGHYGHRAAKATWLFCVGVDPCELPEFRWGHVPNPIARCSEAMVADRPSKVLERLGKRERNLTPHEFAARLVALARVIRRDQAPIAGAG